MGKGIKLRAWHPIDRTHIYDLGNEYNDTGPASFSPFGKKKLVISQGFNNNDDPDNKIPFDIDFEIRGSGFKYDLLGVPTGGNVKKILIFVNGELAYKFTKLDLSVQKVAKWYAIGDPFEKLAKLLKGDDKIIGSDKSDPDLWGGKGDDSLMGKDGHDVLDGFKGNDLNDGGYGNDYLKDTRGKDFFQFSTTLSADYNVDTIQKFGRGDTIYLSSAIFPAIGNKLSKAEFHKGMMAQDGNDHILWDAASRTGYYDPDGSGAQAAIPFFMTNNDAKIDHTVFQVGVLDY